MPQLRGNEPILGLNNVQGEDEGGVGPRFRSWSGWRAITSTSWGARQYEGALGKEASKMRSMV